MDGDGVIEAEAETGEFWVGAVVMEMKCGTRWRILGDGGGSVDAKWACLWGCVYGKCWDRRERRRNVGHMCGSIFY